MAVKCVNFAIAVFVWGSFTLPSQACLRSFVPETPTTVPLETPNQNTTNNGNGSTNYTGYDLSVGSHDYSKGQAISALINTLLEAGIDYGVIGGDAFVCPSFEDALYPDPFDCTYYFKCEAGISLRQKCGAGLGFNNETLVCVPRNDVALCRQLVLDPDYNCTFNGLHAYPKNCQEYYICVNGKGFVAHCGEENAFDSALRLCIPKSKALCLSPTSTPSPK